MNDREAYENLYNKFQNQDYDGAYAALNDLKKFRSEDEINTIKVKILVNKAAYISANNIEASLNLLYQALEIKQSDKKVINETKIYLFDAFKKVYIKKIRNKQYEEIPNVFKKASEFKFITEEMKTFLNLHKNISNFFESLYDKKDNINNKYKKLSTNFFEFICEGVNDPYYNLIINSLVNIYLTSIINDSSYFIEKIQEKNILSGNNKNEKNESEMCEMIVLEINGYIKKRKDNSIIKDLKSLIILKFAKIYFEGKHFKLAEKLFNDFLFCKNKDNFCRDQILANINISQIKFYEKKYIEGYKIIDNLNSLINKKFINNKLDIEWPDENLISQMNTMKINCLLSYLHNEIDKLDFIFLEQYFKILNILLEETKDEITNIEEIQNDFISLKISSLVKYIKEKLDETKFINLDKYFKMAFGILEKIKDEIDINDKKNLLQYFLIEYKKKELKHFFEQKEYKKCIELCEQFILTYQCEKNIFGEIKKIKLDCLKEIADDLVRENKREEFMKLIEEISILQKELDDELGLNTNKKDLINIMSKVINEKAEFFNRNNLYNISENISDLGLQLDPNNIDLITEKSISNSKRGFSYIKKAIENNDKILSLQSDNISAKINKINNISVLNLEDLKKDYINFLIENISTTKLVDVNSKIVIKRSIEVLKDLFKKYSTKIYNYFKNNDNNIIFPKLNLIIFSFEEKELQNESSELLKIYYSSSEGKELIIDGYSNSNKSNESNKVFTFLNKFSLTNFGFGNTKKKEIRKEDICILDIIEKIILNKNILLEVRVNILYLYTKIDIYFIIQLKCYTIPLNFIEFLFKFRDEYSEYINICLHVLLSFIKIDNLSLNGSIKEYLIEYIEKNAKNKNLMIDRTDIEEYFRENKYDESKLEFTFESKKENFKKKYYENLINRVFSEEKIDLKLLKYLKQYGIDLELIINKNKKKIKKNIEIIFKILFEYINSNVNEIKTKDINNINRLLEIESDLFIKDNIINLIYEISNKTDFQNEIPIKLLVDLSKELIKLSNASKANEKGIENSTLFLDNESLLMTNEKRINVIIDTLYNFSRKIKFNSTKKHAYSLFLNLCLYITNQFVNKKNRDKIIIILEDNKEKFSGNIKDIYEIIEKTKNLEESVSDKEKILNMINIENKIKEGYDLNINTTNAINNLISNNKNNGKVLNQAISLINTNVINNKKIDFKLSEKMMNLFLDENVQLEKEIFDNLVICLMNIIYHCKLEEQVVNTLYNNLLNFNKNKVLNKIELITISLKIFTQKHYSFNKEPILKCLYLLANENIVKSIPQYNNIEKIILNSFNNQNLEKEIFNALFEILNKNIALLDCISLCLLNSLKNKEKEEIDILINWNLKKLENLLLNDYFNNNMINLLCKASFDIFSNSEILKSFVFFTVKLKDIKENNYAEPLLIFYSCNKIKICDYHIKIIEDNLEVSGCYVLLLKIMELDETNLLKKIDVNKIVKKLYFDFENGIILIRKLVKFYINFSDESLIQLSKYLYNNHKEDEINGLHQSSLKST